MPSPLRPLGRGETVAIVYPTPLVERWGRWALTSGVVVHGRVAVVAVRVNDADARGWQVKTQPEWRTSAPETLQGDPWPIPKRANRKVLETNRSFETVVPSLSIYLLPDDRLMLVRTTPTEMRKTDAFDQDREPIYDVDFSTELLIGDTFDEMAAQVRAASADASNVESKQAKTVA